MPSKPSKDEIIQAICIGLFASYDNLDLDSAEWNWKNGYGYGAIGSDGNVDLKETAARVYESLDSILKVNHPIVLSDLVVVPPEKWIGQNGFTAEHRDRLGWLVRWFLERKHEYPSNADFYEEAGQAILEERTRLLSTHDQLTDTAAHLAAAISLLERTPKAKKAAPSDKMFEQMLDDYRNSLERARALLNSEDKS